MNTLDLWCKCTCSIFNCNEDFSDSIGFIKVEIYVSLCESLFATDHHVCVYFYVFIVNSFWIKWKFLMSNVIFYLQWNVVYCCIAIFEKS